MVAVFGGIAAGDMVMFQQMGFGLGVAVLLDATLMRSVLVPAAMALLGDRNWYLPHPLRDQPPELGAETGTAGCGDDGADHLPAALAGRGACPAPVRGGAS